MKKTNVTAKNLKRDDRIKIAGTVFRVTNLTLRFGGKKKFDRVSIHAHAIGAPTYINLTVPAKATFKTHTK